jgi:hypothetical protein
MDREKFVELQTSIADRKFALTSGEQSSRERFRQLAIETYDFLISNGATSVPRFDPWPEAAGNPIRNPPRIELTSELTRRWESWNTEYYEIRARNPQLELRDMIQNISESDVASSWPSSDQERRIQEWVDAGDPTARPPFTDRYDIVTLEFFERLRTLRQLCDGWLYWNSDVNGVVFASESKWQSVCSAREAAEAKVLEARTELDARLHRRAMRLQEVLSIARSDAVFWEELRSWELRREAKRPEESSLPIVRQPIGVVRLQGMSSERQAIHANPPVDPIFAVFIARVRKSDDLLTVRDIVLNLRAELRRDIGLDNTIGWPGGPDLGVA